VTAAGRSAHVAAGSVTAARSRPWAVLFSHNFFLHLPKGRRSRHRRPSAAVLLPTHHSADSRPPKIRRIYPFRVRVFLPKIRIRRIYTFRAGLLNGWAPSPHKFSASRKMGNAKHFRENKPALRAKGSRKCVALIIPYGMVHLHFWQAQ